MVLAYLPLLYSNAVLKGESRKFLRLVVNGKSCDECAGGEGGIRTLGTGVSPYNGLANRRIRPLCHLSSMTYEELSLNCLSFWFESAESRAKAALRVASGNSRT